MISPLRPRSNLDAAHHRDSSLLHHHGPSQHRRPAIRKGPLWISAGILILVPLFILNLQLWLYQDPSLQGEKWVESQHWRPPSRILGETPVAKCIQWESTGQLVWVQRDLVQIIVVDTSEKWWFVPVKDHYSTTLWMPTSRHNNHTKLQLVQGPILWPPPKDPQEGPPDLYHFASLGGDDVSPWYAAQRVVQDAFGIPSSLLRIQDYEGMKEGHVPPIAKEHWMFLGRIPLLHLDGDVDAGELSGYMYTYIWKLRQPQQDSNMNVISLGETQLHEAIAQHRFVGLQSLASLAVAMAYAKTGRLPGMMMQNDVTAVG